MPHFMRLNRRTILIALVLLVVGAAVWNFWPRDQVHVSRPFAPVASGDRDVSSTTFDVSASVDDVCWMPDSATLAILTKSGEDNRRQKRSVLTFHVATDRQDVIHETNAVLLGLAIEPVAGNIASASWRTGPNSECEILLWNPISKQPSGPLIGASLTGIGVRITSDPLSLAISPDGRWLAAGTKLVDADGLIGAHIGGEVCVWELATKALKWSDRTTHTDTVQSVVFSSDGKRLASAGVDKLIRIWDVETGRLTATLTGAARNGISSVAFSPDGSLLASGGEGEEDGGCVRLWDFVSGQMKHRFTAFRSHSNVRVAFAADGKSLFAVGLKKDSQEAIFRVHQWEAKTGQYLGMLTEHAGSPRTLSISRDNRQLAVGTFEGQIVVVALPE